MRRVLAFAYGLACYAMFFVTFLYLIGFLANVLVPKGIDGGVPAGIGTAVPIDLALIALFGLQHSVMARPTFKKRLTALLPESVERSTFVLASSLALIALYAWWRPLPQVIWSAQAPLLRTVLWAVLLAGFGIVFLVSFMIDHFDLFGLRQVWFGLLGRAYRHPPFQVTYLYKVVRHPLYLGLLMGLWATPHMTLGHLLFAIGMTGYLLIGIQYEERDLERFLGEDYRRYRQQVPMLVPGVAKPHETVKPRPTVADPLGH
ncbi:MAG: isoprenylcysteine carboxylmethyltransferase family protein [Gammaproteobacteria bacterium]|nr:isoprenylcysteine carboxylmethyltransferase family protein [Gammaproteobacteria bacterium]